MKQSIISSTKPLLSYLSSHATSRAVRRFSAERDEDNKRRIRSKMNVEDRLREMMQNQNLGVTETKEPEKEKPKIPFKLRRSLSPMARVQNLMNENDKNKE